MCGTERNVSLNELTTLVGVSALQAIDDASMLVVQTGAPPVALQIDSTKEPDQEVDGFDRRKHPVVFCHLCDADMEGLVRLGDSSPIGPAALLAVGLPDGSGSGDLVVRAALAGKFEGGAFDRRASS
jgi:hypothetical protein